MARSGSSPARETKLVDTASEREERSVCVCVCGVLCRVLCVCGVVSCVLCVCGVVTLCVRFVCVCVLYVRDMIQYLTSLTH